MEYKKLLVISHNCFSKTGSNGRTLANYLKGWPKEKIAQIYIHPESPDFDICSQYYCISDKDVLKSILMLNSTFLLNLYQDCLLKLEDMMTNQRIKEMPVEQRLEAYFRQCRSRYIYTTHQQLADKLQTSREVVSRQLKKMEKEGRLQISRGKIILNEEVF